MIAVVKRSGLSPAQKLLWLDLVPYKGEGCHKTARAQAEDLKLSESSVDQWRRLFVRLGLAQRGEHRPEWGGPRPTWIACFPQDLVPPSSKREFRDTVIRMAAQLDLRIEYEVGRPAETDTHTPELDQQHPHVVAPTPLSGLGHVAMGAEQAAVAAGAFRGEGGKGGGVALSATGSKTLLIPDLSGNRNSPDGEELRKTPRTRVPVGVVEAERAAAWLHRVRSQNG